MLLWRLSPFAVGREEPPRARQQVVADLAPVREPARALGLERAPPGEEFVAFGLCSFHCPSNVDLPSDSVLAHALRPGQHGAAGALGALCCWP